MELGHFDTPEHNVCKFLHPLDHHHARINITGPLYPLASVKGSGCFAISLLEDALNHTLSISI